jgi:hypothetical protein
MSDDRESGYEAAARIRARGLRHTSPCGDGGGQTRLTGLLGERVIRPDASDRRDQEHICDGTSHESVRNSE